MFVMKDHESGILPRLLSMRKLETIIATKENVKIRWQVSPFVNATILRLQPGRSRESPAMSDKRII